MKKRHLLALLAILTLFSLKAQDLHTAPTLQIGLGGIDFTKGAFDTELVAEIIGEKQEEIKRDLIKKMLLRSLNGKSELFYKYIDKSIDILVNEKDPEVLSKNLIENTVNLTFVIAYAEYYRNTALTNEKLFSTLETAINYFSEYKIDSFQATQNVAALNTKNNRIDLSNSGSGDHADNLNNYENKDAIEERDKVNGKMLDIVAEAVRRSDALKSLGLMRNNYTSALRDFDANEEKVINQVQKHLKKHLKYFAVIKSLVNLKAQDIDTITSDLKTLRDDAIEYNYARIKGHFEAIQAALVAQELSQVEKESLKILQTYFADLRYIKSKPMELLNRYESEAKPALSNLSTRAMGTIDLEHMLFDFLFIKNSENFKKIKKLNIDLKSPFMKLIETLDEFDKVSTYDQYLNLLSDAGDYFINPNRRDVINKVITLIRSYIKFEGESLKELNFKVDVEGFVSALQNINLDRWQPWEIHFTVGMNNLRFNDKLKLGETELRNYSYMAEKIGIKLKFWDWSYTRSFNKDETYTYYGLLYKRNQSATTPLVSNAHLLLYGSGLLYNIVNTGTSADFNYPLLGIGLGITFSNALDFNVSMGRPITPEHSLFSKKIPGFVNIGFDIQFSEYLSRLNKKRKANQTQKLLANAQQAAPTTTIPNNLGISQ